MQSVTYFLIIIVIVVVLAIISGVITRQGLSTEWWRSVKVSPNQPNAPVFSIMWVIIYIILIISTYAAVYRLNQWGVANISDINIIIGLLTLNMGLQLLWCHVYFGTRNLIGGVVCLILTLIAAITLAYYVGRVVPVAGIALLVYIIWLGFATYFNIETVRLN